MSIPKDRDVFYYNDVKSAFGPSAFSPGTIIGNPQKQTMLSSLAGKLNTSVSASSIQQHSVDMTKGNAGAKAEVSKVPLAGIGQQATAIKANITQTLEQAQRVVSAVADEVVGPGATADMYPKDTSPESVAELGLQAFIGAKSGTGFGSLAMKTANNMMSVEDVVSDRRKFPDKESAEAAITEQLRAIASAPPPDTRAGFEMAMSADPAPQGPKESNLDWNAFFDNGHTLKDLMLMDPKNPPASLVPEFAQADNMEREATKELATATYAIEKTKDERGPQNIDADHFKGCVHCTGAGLTEIASMKSNSTSFALDPQLKLIMEAERIAATHAAKLQNEPDPRLYQQPQMA